MVAHELRNPLTPISLIAERMVRLPSDQLPRVRELIESQVRHISQLVEGTITLSASIDSDVLEIRISDDGIGISPSLLPFIFNPYVQDEHAIGFNGNGLGIGLTVVRELIEAHGGKVTAASQGNGWAVSFW
ncbi:MULTISPECIES: sensor histidine kinase [Pseudomonas syringae group]|uniref:sensor histidine kinase n=1 Tax=Pseudomonas syringae group TaxID=136849 RepID=UPI001E385D45|nr:MULTISPECIES: ATP-binding protein [Pseudomonas syringae group]